MEHKKTFWKGLLLGAVLTLALAEGLPFGAKALEEWKKSNSETAQVDLTNSRVEKKLTTLEEIINTCYLEEINPEQVEDYLYKGALAGLGDIYTTYYTKEEYQSVKESTSGSYSGIGVQISQDISTGQVTITQVFEESPAKEVGILQGDILYQVEDLPATGEDLEQIVSKIKGEEHTKARVVVLRGEKREKLEFQVERRTIEVQSVSYEMLENQTGYIAISSFDDVTAGQFETALKALEEQGMEALVVDVRNNGGGLVSDVCEILDLLLPEGLIVYTEDKNGKRVEEYSDAEHFFDKPLAVLVNGYSASASEIFAGAIKDYGVGTLVGTQTFGKGIVQHVIPLGDGSAVKVTVSKYYTPNGANIHGVGIEPDVKVELPEELQNQSSIEKEEDTQLQKALEILQEKTGQNN